MVKRKLLFLAPVLFLFLLIALPLALAENNLNDLTEDDCIYYFHGDGCIDCPETEEYLQQLEEKYPELQIERFEIYFNKENYNELQDFYTSYRIPEASQKLPAAFILGTYFIGKDSITALLEDRILDNEYAECPSPNDLVVGVIGEGSSKNVLETLTFFRVSGSALAQVYSPVMIALMLILIFVLMAIPDHEQMFKKGFVFIIGTYLAYLLFSLGFFSSLISPQIGSIFFKVVGILAIVVSLAIIKNFFGTLRVLFDQTPEKLAQKARKTWQGFLSYPGVFLIGFLTTLFTFSLVNSTMFVLRDLYIKEIERVAVVPLICYYILLLVIRLIVLVAGLYAIRRQLHNRYVEKHREGMNDIKYEAWRKHIIKVTNLVLSVIVLILGIVLLFV